MQPDIPAQPDAQERGESWSPGRESAGHHHDEVSREKRKVGAFGQPVALDSALRLLTDAELDAAAGQSVPTVSEHLRLVCRRREGSSRKGVDENVAFVVPGSVVEAPAAAEQEQTARLCLTGRAVRMGLVEQLLAPGPELVLVHLDGRCSHGIRHLSSVSQCQGDDLPGLVVGQVRERAPDPARVDVAHQDACSPTDDGGCRHPCQPSICKGDGSAPARSPDGYRHDPGSGRCSPCIRQAARSGLGGRTAQVQSWAADSLSAKRGLRPQCFFVLQRLWRPHLASRHPYRPGLVARAWPGLSRFARG